MSAQVLNDAADTTSDIREDTAVVLATSTSAAAAVALDVQTTSCSVPTVDLASCSESVSATELTTSTAAPLTAARRSSAVRAAHSAVNLEEPASTDELLQCGECKKCFRSQTLLDYHKKYYHHVAVTGTGRVTTRRTSLPALQLSERTPSSQFCSKNQSTCMCMPQFLRFFVCFLWRQLYWALVSVGLALYHPSISVSSIFMVLHSKFFGYIFSFAS